MPQFSGMHGLQFRIRSVLESEGQTCLSVMTTNYSVKLCIVQGLDVLSESIKVMSFPTTIFHGPCVCFIHHDTFKTFDSTAQLRCVQATIALMKDGTVAVEVSLSVALVQWPFLTDISLAWAAASIFDPGAAELGCDPGSAAASKAFDSILKSPERAPWLYFNCILEASQLFVPVADPASCSSILHLHLDAAQEC